MRTHSIRTDDIAGLWLTAIVAVPLWRYAPWAVVVLIILAALGGIAVMRERHRRRVQGYWVEYLSPNTLRANEHEFAVAYHEGNECIYFQGRQQPRPERDRLCIPSAAAWDGAVPLWAKGRREVIQERLLANWLVKRCEVVEQ
jgi:hypothetical protein